MTNTSASMRLGIMGGMFDPVHTGHLRVAQTAQLKLNLDQVRLIPCSIPGHRASAQTSAEHRLAMLEAAIADYPGFVVDTRELQRPGTSYMVDTLGSLRAEFPQATMVYIMGMDSFLSLPSWHRWRDILDLTHLYVVSRDELSQANAEPALQTELAARLVSRQEELFDTLAGRILVLTGINLPQSSTRVRRDARQTGTIAIDDVPTVVADYIKTHKLYR